MFVFTFHACEFSRALEYMSNDSPKICARCRAVVIGPAETIAMDRGTGWSAHRRLVTLCGSCGDRLEDFLRGDHGALDGPGGALASTAVASMDLAGGPA